MTSTRRVVEHVVVDTRRGEVEQEDVKRYYSMDAETDSPTRRVTPPSDDYYLGLLVQQEGTTHHQQEQLHHHHTTKMKGLLWQRKLWRTLSILLFLIFSISTVTARCLDPMPQRRQRQGVERPPMVSVFMIVALLSLISFFAAFFQFFLGVQRQLDDFRGELVPVVLKRNSNVDDSSPPTAAAAGLQVV